MKGLSKDNFFFFGMDCSDLEIFPNTVEHAYLAILDDDLDSAQAVFERIDSPRAKWGTILVSILKGYMRGYPTYFQIRNFLEIDIDFLLKNDKINYVELCLGALEVLSGVNQEAFKFAARVMLENKLYKAALKYMERSKQIHYKDAELHFMYAKYYMDRAQYENAYFYINECLKLIPEYYPAIIMKQRIEELNF